MTTKTLFTALAIAALVAAPALAAKKPVRHSTAAGPYASATAGQTNPTVGTDPDQRIRFELLRDSDTSEGLN
jgi:hypothetical protein